MADGLTNALATLTQPSNQASFVRSFGSAVFDEVVLDSQVSPEITLQPWAPGDGERDTPPSPLPGLVGRYFRPRARLMKAGKTVATFAPFGEPNGTWLPDAIGATSAVVAATSFVLGHRKFAKSAAIVSAVAFGWGYFTRGSSP